MQTTTDQDWPTAAPEDVDMDGAVLEGLAPQFQAWPEANIHAALIVRGGRLVHESYFAGEDEHWGRPLGRVAYDAGSRHDLRSITKSVTALIAGIVLGPAWERALATPVFELFPEHADLATGGKETMTLAHLFEMSSAWPGTRTGPTATHGTASG
jgi:CubicO group peptidase (beta-lactamase class C family)